MNLFTIFLIIDFCAIHNSVAGIPNSNNERIDPILMEPIENYEEMQRYIDNSSNADAERLDSYILAYSHDKDQINEEEKTAAARRLRRSAPQFIKFELSDAKEPDERTKEFLRHVREQRTLEMETVKMQQSKIDKSDENVEEPGFEDHVPIESRRIHVYQTPGKRSTSLSKIPAGVRKAIDSVLQKKSLYKIPPNKRYASSLDFSKQSFRHKPLSFAPIYGKLPYKFDNSIYKPDISLDFANQIPFIPALFPALPQDAPNPTLSTLILSPPHHQPELQYVPPIKLEEELVTQKVEESLLTHQPYDNANINLPQEEKNIQISFENLGDYGKDINEDYNIFKGSENPITKFDGPVGHASMTQVLTDLISKTSTEQLQGLSQLLAAEHLHQHQFPKDSTAPVLFPPVKVAAVEAAPSHQGEYLQSHVATEYPKEYTPITEQQEDVTPAPIVHFVAIKPHSTPVTPVISKPADIQAASVPTSYKEIRMGLSPNYEESGHQHYLTDEKTQYAAGYEFGYRIRDFHTGNDFGHSENSDGDGITRGQYHTLLPDGRLQNVQYHVDDSGYHADVTYQSTH